MFTLDAITGSTITSIISLRGTGHTSKDFKIIPLFVLLDADTSSSSLDLSAICGRVDDMTVTHDRLIVEWHYIASPVAELAKTLANIRLSLIGTGDGIVTVYTLLAFSLTSDEYFGE